MNRTRRAGSVAMAVAVAMTVGIVLAEEGTQFQLVNKLGVETTFSVNQITHGDDLLNSVAGTWRGSKVVVSLGDGVFLGIPYDGMRDATLSNGVHVVTLTNGETVSGKLISTVTTADQKKYDLSTATRLTITPAKVQATKPGGTRKTERQDAKVSVQWELRITKPSSARYAVTNPRFVYQYYSSSGYLMGGSDRETTSTSFYLKVGTEEMLAELSDFARVNMDTKLTLTAKGGTETTGDLVLKSKDDKGEHTAGQRAFVADLPNGQIIFIRSGTWSLTKSTE